MSRYETPPYTVIAKDGAIEVRRYEAFSVVTYTSSQDPYGEAAFNTLFRYIQGDNRSNQRIAMTVPVFESPATAKKGMAMSFVVPQKVLDAIPKPKHPDLHIETFKPGDYAVITFSGTASRTRVLKQEAILSQWLADKGKQAVSEMYVAYYNAPFTLPFMRHNEVLVAIAASEVSNL